MKTSRLLLFAGTALLLVAFALFAWNAAPIIISRLYTSSIPTAPSLSQSLPGSEISGTPDAGDVALLPFERTGIVTLKTTILITSPTPANPPPTETATPNQPTTAPRETRNATPSPPIGVEPSNLRIPILELDAPVVPIGLKTVTINGESALMWDVPGYRVAGWHETSARLGLPGNTVLNGHNTSSGEVFRDLYKIPVGALVILESQRGEEFAYRVKEKYILPEAGQPLEVRFKNALYIQGTQDERVTMITCHPYGSLANRLIVIAVPAPPTPQRGE